MDANSSQISSLPSDTPRTNAAIVGVRYWSRTPKPQKQSGEMVPVEISRQLEWELREAVIALRDTLDQIFRQDTVDKVESVLKRYNQ